MVTVHDVAAYILNTKGEMTTWKLQKLVYYSQAWSLVWDDEPLFGETIEAWANGPVVRELYTRHKGDYYVSDWDGDPNALSSEQAATVDSVLEYYGDESGKWLSELTHLEAPWRTAREGLSPGARRDRAITHGSMSDYYSQISD